MKKLFSLLLVIALLVTSMAVTASAAGTAVSVSDATAEPGDTVTLDVSISGNPGFVSGTATISYDTDALKLVSLENGLFNGVANVDTGKINHASATAVTDDGVLFKAKFEVVAETAGEYDVDVTFVDARGNNTLRADDGTRIAVADATGTVKVTVTCKHANTTIVGAKEATCTAEGYTGDKVCSDCGEIVTKGTVIAKKAHTTELKNAKEATCTAEGYTGDKVCSVCGETVEKGTVIPMADHTFDWIVDKNATATEDGLKHEECSVCGYAKEAVVIPATGEELDDVPQTGDIVTDSTPVIVLTIFAVCVAAAYVIKRRFAK